MTKLLLSIRHLQLVASNFNLKELDESENNYIPFGNNILIADYDEDTMAVSFEKEISIETAISLLKDNKIDAVLGSDEFSFIISKIFNIKKISLNNTVICLSPINQFLINLYNNLEDYKFSFTNEDLKYIYDKDSQLFNTLMKFLCLNTNNNLALNGKDDFSFIQKSNFNKFKYLDSGIIFSLYNKGILNSYMKQITSFMDTLYKFEDFIKELESDVLLRKKIIETSENEFKFIINSIMSYSNDLRGSTKFLESVVSDYYKYIDTSKLNKDILKAILSKDNIEKLNIEFKERDYEYFKYLKYFSSKNLEVINILIDLADHKLFKEILPIASIKLLILLKENRHLVKTANTEFNKENDNFKELINEMLKFIDGRCLDKYLDIVIDIVGDMRILVKEYDISNLNNVKKLLLEKNLKF